VEWQCRSMRLPAIRDQGRRPSPFWLAWYSRIGARSRVIDHRACVLQSVPRGGQRPGAVTYCMDSRGLAQMICAWRGKIPCGVFPGGTKGEGLKVTSVGGAPPFRVLHPVSTALRPSTGWGTDGSCSGSGSRYSRSPTPPASLRVAPRRNGVGHPTPRPGVTATSAEYRAGFEATPDRATPDSVDRVLAATGRSRASPRVPRSWP
jgi:hypothetical protein